MMVLNTRKIYTSSLPVDIITYIRAWFHEATNKKWKSYSELKEDYPCCLSHNNKVHFPIAGTTYVIITRINFAIEVVLILEIQVNE